MKKIGVSCPFIVLLSGTPGAGKSTLRQALEEKKNWLGFDLNNFVLENKLYIAEDTKRDTKVIDMDNAIKKSAIKLLELFRDLEKRKSSDDPEDNQINRYVIIIDSHYSDIIVDAIEELVKNFQEYAQTIKVEDKEKYYKKIIDCYSNKKNIIAIILRCAPKILEKRLNSRGYNNEKILENIQAEILGESSSAMLEVLDKEKIFEVDTSLIEIDTAIKIVENLVNNNVDYLQKFKFGQINWLGQLASSGELEQYFKKELGEKNILDFDLNKKNEN
ncbi:MAG: AAA family ATPase [Promethearchaeota archaeon]